MSAKKTRARMTTNKQVAKLCAHAAREQRIACTWGDGKNRACFVVPELVGKECLQGPHASRVVEAATEVGSWLELL